MFFAEVINEDIHCGYIVETLEELIKTSLKITERLAGEDIEYNPHAIGGWQSIDDEIKNSSSFEELQSLLYEFASGTGTTFRISNIKSTEEIELMH